MSRHKDLSTKIRSIASAFPLPSFLAMSAAAIDISDTSVKYMDMEYTKSGNIPRNFDSAVLKNGIVSAGVVQNPAALADLLRQFKEKYKRAFAFVALPEELAYLYTIRIQKSKDVNLKESVEFSLSENVPINIENAIFDYDIISITQNNIEVSVTVYERGVVEGYVRALELAGFTVRLCELEARSVVRSVVPRGDKRISMVIDFGRTRTGITIADGQTPIFTTTVHVGGESVTKAIMELKSVTEEEADALKRDVGLLGDGDEKLQDILTSSVGELIKEIERHYQFWDSKRDLHGEHIDRINDIRLCGGAASLRGLQEYIASKLHIPVHNANVWQNMFDLDSYIPPISRELSWQYATTVGLLLNDIK